MNGEHAFLAALSRDQRIDRLLADIVSAAERSLKAEPGDRADVVRYEALCVQLEAAAAEALANGAPRIDAARMLTSAQGLGFTAATQREPLHLVEDPVGPNLADRLTGSAADAVRDWSSAGYIVVLLRIPFSGQAHLDEDLPKQAPEPEEAWQAPDGAVGRKAVEERFRAQLQAACDTGAADTRAAVNPSGIHNRVVTEVLREFVQGRPETRVDAPVVYRDGSQASHAFPLRCLPLGQDVPENADRTLDLALLSIRHTEMDPVVDGAWLRNAEVSRPRPAAQTDDYVYATSRRQFDQLTDHGRISAVLRIYQTGLDTAVVGFYRAVVAHLLEHPGALTVVPMFYATKPAGDHAVLRPEAHFEAGAAWSTVRAR